MSRVVMVLGALILVPLAPIRGDEPKAAHERGTAATTLTRSAGSGRWSEPKTWEDGRVPGSGARVQVRTGHTVTYDAASDQPIRSIHVAGTLRLDPDRDTRLVVGLIKIQAGDDASENGFDCDAHLPQEVADDRRPALVVGNEARPIPVGRSALIRLVSLPDMDPETCPAIISCGGRLDLAGAPIGRSWVKLGATARAGQDSVRLAEPVKGWRVGDRVIVTATQRVRRERATLRAGQGKESMKAFTEERLVTAIDDDALTITLDRPLAEDHRGEGDYRGEVANLSRNVVIESADPATARGRGHVMYHRASAGSIRYAEFRHLGKEGLLGKYSLHFHLAGDTMRGSSVVGASFWDSGNRWVTIHATNYLVVRDCVGYQSVGHGFYLEDGTEVDTVFDRNLAVQAFVGNPLPAQNLPFDNNGGAGFWWANSRNTFTRNVAVECDRYGYKFEATPVNAAKPGLNVIPEDDTPESFDLRLPIRLADGTRSTIDIRTLSFIRFDENEAHSNLYGINLGEGVRGVGPDPKHPFVLRATRLWNNFWAFRPGGPSVVVDGMDVYNGRYGLYRPAYDHHAYSRLTIAQVENPQAFGTGEVPRGFDVPGPPKATGPVRAPEIAKGAAAPANLGPFIMNPMATTPGLPEVNASSTAFPSPLTPVDDLPPATVITSTKLNGRGEVIVRGTTSDSGVVERVVVSGTTARPLRPNFAEWEAVLPVSSGGLELSAAAVDEAGNIETRPHRVQIAAP